MHGYDARYVETREYEEYWGEEVSVDVCMGSCDFRYYCEKCNNIQGYCFDYFCEHDFNYEVEDEDKKGIILHDAIENLHRSADQEDSDLSVIEAACKQNGIDFNTLKYLANNPTYVKSLAEAVGLFDEYKSDINKLSEENRELKCKYEPESLDSDWDDDIPF